ncbi:MAG: hypothetical protein J0I71_02935 [Rhodanobacter sp.]|nr:hypothetical protein [Rhodanobacter sp.]
MNFMRCINRAADWRRAPIYWGLMAITVLLGLLYVGKAWTPSSYAITLNVLGVDAPGPTFGQPRDTRSDEFFVQTPHFQTAVLSGLADTDRISPYDESLRNFMAFPTKDWSIVFKPALWGFIVLPAAYAYSLYFFVLAAACLWGWLLVLRFAGAPLAIALCGTILLTFSQMLQVWWTTNAPTFAFAPWVAIAFLAPRLERTRFVAVFVAMVIWLFALLYPPFIYAEAVAIAAIIAAFRPDALRWRALLVSGLAAALAAAIVYLYLHDTIEVMRQSVYPGKRSLDGGTLPWSQAAATILPYVNIIGFDPTLLAPETRNACETGVVGSYLALLLACFVEPSSFVENVRAHRARWLLLAASLCGMASWMLLPIPHTIGHLLLLDMVPPARLLLGFGLLFHMTLLLVAPSLRYRMTIRRAVIFFIIVAGVLIVRKGGLPGSELRQSWFDGVIFICLPIAVVVALWLRLRTRRSGVEAIPLVAAAAACNLLTFGTFNPIQSALPIFAAHTQGIVQDLKALEHWDDRGLVVLNAWRGSALTGLGIRAVNDTLMSPQLAYFRREFPQLDAATRDRVFNRFGHITPRFIPAPNAAGDQIFVPIQHYAQNRRLLRDDLASTQGNAGNISSYSVIRDPDNGYDIEVVGWAPWHGVDPSQRMLFRGDAHPVGVIREPRLDVAEALNDPTLRVAGFRAYFTKADGSFPALQLRTREGERTTQIPGLLGLAIDPSAHGDPTNAGEVSGALDSWDFDEQNRTLTVQGWMHVNPEATSSIVVGLAGVTAASIERVERPDVAAVFGEAWRHAGFKLVVSLSSGSKPDEDRTCIIASGLDGVRLPLAAPGRPSGCSATVSPRLLP